MPVVRHLSLTGPLAALSPITLDEMDAIKLMNRIDSKYLTDETCLVEILRDAAASGYRVLEAGGERVSPYDSIYYDTEGLKMFSGATVLGDGRVALILDVATMMQ